ncbi:MAG: DNA-binding protein [Actinomycetota bacterium]|nr:DNA-binding protein [Actinomycetota bacterium]
MTEYDFTLRFDVSGVDADSDERVELLAVHGCDDALIGTGIPGRIALEFTREAPSPEHAVLSAITDVKTALPQATLIEATPDFVGYTEVAEIVGKSRQNMRKLLLARGATGPIPVHEGPSTIWHLAPVLTWLRDEKQYEIDSDSIDLARTTMHVNMAAMQVGCGSVIDERITRLLSGTGDVASSGRKERRARV